MGKLQIVGSGRRSPAGPCWADMGQGKGIIFLLDGEGEGTVTGLLWVRLSRKTKSVDLKDRKCRPLQEGESDDKGGALVGSTNRASVMHLTHSGPTG